MKKTALLFIFFISFCTSIFFHDQIDEKTLMVSTEKISNENEKLFQVYLMFDETKLTTKNFTSILKNINVLTIYPEFKEIYADKFSWQSYNFSNNKNDLNLFFNKYINVLKDLALDEEIVQLEASGIRLKAVLVEISNTDLVKLTKQYKISYNITTTKEEYPE